MSLANLSLAGLACMKNRWALQVQSLLPNPASGRASGRLANAAAHWCSARKASCLHQTDVNDVCARK